MKCMGDSNWWRTRFKARALNLLMPEKHLVEDLTYFPPTGRILDLACGDGRNAIYLARLGYEVIAIDFCEEALGRLNYFAQKESLNIQTKLIDCSKKESLLDLGQFDGIIINHYRLSHLLCGEVMNHLNRDGVLWINGFIEIPKDNPNITESDLLVESDFIDLAAYRLENKDVYEIGQRKFVRYMWRK